MSAEWLRELAARLRGRRVSGGCDECNTYQTLEERTRPWRRIPIYPATSTSASITITGARS
jgi:hypothetical protein